MMPIEPDRLEARIYTSRWRGDVTADDFQQAHQGGVELARDHDEEDFYVLILDMDDSVSLPINAQAAQYVLETVTYDIMAVIIGVNAPPTMKAILAGLDLASPQVSRTETVHTLDAALTLAREIVAQHTP